MKKRERQIEKERTNCIQYIIKKMSTKKKKGEREKKNNEKGQRQTGIQGERQRYLQRKRERLKVKERQIEKRGQKALKI